MTKTNLKSENMYITQNVLRGILSGDPAPLVVCTMSSSAYLGVIHILRNQQGGGRGEGGFGMITLM